MRATVLFALTLAGAMALADDAQAWGRRRGGAYYSGASYYGGNAYGYGYGGYPAYTYSSYPAYGYSSYSGYAYPTYPAGNVISGYNAGTIGTQWWTPGYWQSNVYQPINSGYGGYGWNYGW
jgi:hypothetical protein